MPTIYYLSGRQAKELLIRGRRLNIALPTPPMPQTDWIAWARSVLDPEIRSYVVAAIRDEVRVRPTGDGGLAEWIGQIDLDADARYWTFAVAIIRVSLSPPHPRGETPKIQWPHHCMHDGIRIPPAEENQP